MSWRAVSADAMLAARLVGARAGLTAQRLLTLDELWTAELHAELPSGALAERYDALHLLVVEQREGLVSIRDHVRALGVVLAAVTDGDFNEALWALADSPAVSADAVKALVGDLDDSPRLASVYACRYVYAAADEEGRLLDAKLDQIERGERPSGDFRLPFLCALTLVGVAGGVIATVGLGGPVGFVALSVASQVGLGAVGWIGSKCPNLVELLKKEAPPPEPPPPPPPAPQPQTPGGVGRIVRGADWVDIGGVRVPIRQT